MGNWTVLVHYYHRHTGAVPAGCSCSCFCSLRIPLARFARIFSVSVHNTSFTLHIPNRLSMNRRLSRTADEIESVLAFSKRVAHCFSLVKWLFR